MSAPHGFHWSPCNSGGLDLGPVLAIGAVIGIGAGAAFIIAAIMWWLIAAFAVLAVLAGWWLATQPKRQARWAAAYRAGFAVREEASAAKAIQGQQVAIELARASALIAAAITGAQPQPLRVVRSEIVKPEVQR